MFYNTYPVPNLCIGFCGWYKEVLDAIATLQEHKIPLRTQNKHNAEQTDLGANPSSTTYQLCDLEQSLNLSAPLFPHL